MLPNKKIVEIQNLLSQGLSGRKVARLSHTSKGLVGTVKSGKRKTHHNKFTLIGTIPCARKRCGGCGGTVVLWPCVACSIRQRRAI